MINMNVTDQQYDTMTKEGRELYDSLANHFTFDCKPSESTRKGFYEQIAGLTSEIDRQLLTEFLNL
jgi:hypothetical protein